LTEGEAAHPANYRGCKHAKEELLKKRKSQGPPKPAGRVFSSRTVQANVSFAAALRGHTAEHKQQEAAVVTSKPQPEPAKPRQTATGQSVPALPVNSEAADMVKIITVVRPASRKRRRKGNPVVSGEAVMYGYESSATLTTDRLYYKIQTRPLVREGRILSP
jgi:hypothetical protein